jgi:hypothetical protein
MPPQQSDSQDSSAIISSGNQAQNRREPPVMIYGVGSYALEAVRILIEKRWPIVGAVNRAGPKIGQDLGRLADLNVNLGVIVQDCETADYASFDAEIALFIQTERLNLNWMMAYSRLLGAGINVICQGSESYFSQGAIQSWPRKSMLWRSKAM